MRRSIRLDLLKWLIGPLVVINLVGAGLTFWLAWTPSLAAWDQSLADTAWALEPRLRATDAGVTIDLPQEAEQVLRVDHVDAIYFVVRDAQGRTLAGDADFPAMAPMRRNDEPRFEDGTMRGETVRIAILQTAAGGQPILIGVAETVRKRVQARWQILVTLFLLEALLSCVSLLIVWTAVRRGLSPLKRMQQDLSARSARELSPVADVGAPLELEPLLGAVNDLLTRAQEGATANQDFLADVAHQLRTPLAGAKIHMEWLLKRHAGDPDSAHVAAMVLASTERMIRQTNQLLSLARAEPSQFSRASFDTVALEALVGDSVQHFVQQADLRSIDLGFDLQPARVQGDAFLLRDMIDNLIDNAIRYGPDHGTVTVRCWEDQEHAMLRVEDNGPGIAQCHREAVFERFYRVGNAAAGSGLGLAIVRDIVLDHGAQIRIEPGDNGVGTVVTIVFDACSAAVAPALQPLLAASYRQPVLEEPSSGPAHLKTPTLPAG